MHVTVRSVGRNVVLLLTDGAQFFSCTYAVFDQLYKAGQQASNRYSNCDLPMTESCLIKQHIFVSLVTLWLCQSFKVSWDLYPSGHVIEMRN